MSSVAAVESGSMPTLLGVAFVVLKLSHVIVWSWMWVLAPFWLPYVIVLFIIGVFLILVAAAVAGGERL